MTALIRSFVFLFIAIFVAGTFALSVAPLKAEASVAMAATAMASGGQDCAKCDPTMDKAAICDLMCALSMPAILVGPVDQAVVLADCHFETAEASQAQTIDPATILRGQQLYASSFMPATAPPATVSTCKDSRIGNTGWPQGGCQHRRMM